ncbi:MAG: M23 family metallopeptidase [Thermoleophilia bacterium]|nr:M23 family metallopeptidase [Thermoleophilia bacterium]
MTALKPNSPTSLGLGLLIFLGWCLLGANLSATAGAAEDTGARTSVARDGGIVIEPDPEINDAYCVRDCVSRHEATPGAVVRLTGAYLDKVKRVIFPGKDGKMKVDYRARSSVAVRVVVPKGADDGRPYVINSTGEKSNRSPNELQIVPRSLIPKEVFPVRGPHDYGGSGARFGAGRAGWSHQGQDIMAACGTKLVAIKGARVIYNQFQSAAGNYVVFNNKGENTYFAFMHLRKPSKLKVGEKVQAGDTVGRVGETGDAVGCHLHFEYWIGPWQTGGRPIDPLHYLKSID